MTAQRNHAAGRLPTEATTYVTENTDNPGQRPTAILYRARYWRSPVRRQLPYPFALRRPAGMWSATGRLVVVLPAVMLSAATQARADLDPTRPLAMAPRPAGPALRDACQRRQIGRLLGCPLPGIPAPMRTGVQSLSGSLSAMPPEVPDFSGKTHPVFYAGSGLVHPAGPACRPRRRVQAPETRWTRQHGPAAHRPVARRTHAPLEFEARCRAASASVSRHRSSQ